MAEETSTVPDSSKQVEWMWKSNADPWSNTEPVDWKHYSDVENLIIEEAYLNNQPKAEFDKYYIDFEHRVQISTDDKNKQRPVKRVECEKEDKHLREERFMDSPITAQLSMGGEYGWVSPFITEVRKDLGLKKKELPSKNQDLIPTLVETAALGIIEEGTQLGSQREAEHMAALLREKKDKEYKEVWERCVYLYSLETFLYKKLNEAMRMVGTKEYEDVWRSKVRTLGPFCLLLWDDPVNQRVRTDTTLYRGAQLTSEQIAVYEDMTKHPDAYHSFQAFTSCTRNREKAEKFGNILFIIKVLHAFVADISSLSQYKEEEEELVTPGACFCVEGVTVDPKTNKHMITLGLRQRWSSKHEQEFLIVFFCDQYFFLHTLSRA